MATPTFPVHIAMLDDHRLFRQGMRYILRDLSYVDDILEASELPELLAYCRQRVPDVLLLDLQMPNIDGLQCAQQLLEEFPELKIIVLSMLSADKFVAQMVKLGARCYLPKDVDQEQLVQAIEDVLLTGYHFTPQISRLLVEGVQKPTRHNLTKLPPLVELTAREQEVLRLLCTGSTTAKIADQLFISPRTVEGHRQKLLEKTGAANVAGLVAFAAREGMLD